MRRVLIGGAAALALAAGGGWLLWSRGAAQVEAAFDAEVAALAAQGAALTWGAREMGGFPFGYALTLREVRLVALEGGMEIAAPWARTEAGFPNPTVARTTLAPEARLTVAPPPDAGLGPIGFALISRDLVVESPLADTTSHRFGATSLSLRAVEGWPAGALEMTLDGLSGDVRAEGDGRFAHDVAAGRITMVADGPGPDGRVLRTESESENMRLAGSGRVVEAADLGGFLTGGGTLDVDLAVGRGGQRNEAYESTSEGGTFRFRLGAQGFDLGFDIAPQTFSLKPGQQVLPAGAGKVGAVRGGLAFPLVPATDPQRWSYAATLESFEADEAIWAALDPAGRLARGPLSADLALSGNMRVLKPLDAPATPGEAPVALDTIDVERLKLAALGAEAEATGALRLIEGQDAPDGTLSVRVAGWQPLLDALAATGAVGPDQAAMARLMAARFGRPDAGPGVFAAEIALSGGLATVNGLPLQ